MCVFVLFYLSFSLSLILCLSVWVVVRVFRCCWYVSSSVFVYELSQSQQLTPPSRIPTMYRLSSGYSPNRLGFFRVSAFCGQTSAPITLSNWNWIDSDSVRTLTSVLRFIHTIKTCFINLKRLHLMLTLIWAHTHTANCKRQLGSFVALCFSFFLLTSRPLNIWR